MWVRGAAGVILLLVGALWIGQGTGAVSGSFMSGRSLYAVLGAVLVVAGLGLLGWAVSSRRRRSRGQ